jgi:hypothetical protein
MAQAVALRLPQAHEEARRSAAVDQVGTGAGVFEERADDLVVVEGEQ